MSFFLSLLLLGPSVRAVYKYLPWPNVASAVMLGAGFCAYFLLMRCMNRLEGRNRVRLSRVLPICSAFFMAFAIGTTYVIYPIAHAARGHTASDAFILAATAFLSNGSMYSQWLSNGVPISPGPGWVLLNLPLLSWDNYWVISPLYIVLSVFVVSLFTRRSEPAAFYICLVSSSLLFWELLAEGQDVVAIGFAFLAVSVLAYSLSRACRPRLIWCVAVGVLSGLVATSRIVFNPLPLLLALLLWRMNRMVALVIGGAGMLVAGSLNLYFASISDYYQPVHLIFNRGANNVGLPVMVGGVAAAVLVLTYAYRSSTGGFADWTKAVWVCLFVPLAFVSLGELRSGGFSFLWEGANDIFPCVPLYLLYVAATMFPPRDADEAALAEAGSDLLGGQVSALGIGHQGDP